MTTPIHDMIGIGFGPANLAIAIAMDESPQAQHLDCCFIEKQPEFEWHGGMLLANTHLQVSFLKDLVTLRDPTSRFSFINYLHEKQRLNAFINMGTFFPNRLEYNDYLRWAARAFDDRVHYAETVIAVEPEATGADGGVDVLVVRSRRDDGTVIARRAREVVVGIGGQPKIPEVFMPHREDPRVIHSAWYGTCRARFDGPSPRLAVIGAGQSGAEIFRNLMDRYPEGEVDLISRDAALHPSDDSPFVNEIFDPEFTDRVYNSSPATQHALLEKFRHTNYSVVDLPLIDELYRRLYHQEVTGARRHAFLPYRNIAAVESAAERIRLNLIDTRTQRPVWVDYDGVVLATGYHRQGHLELLSALRPWMTGESVTRDYRVPMTPECRARIFLQGCCEETHGLADTLLSILAVRSREVVAALTQNHRETTTLRQTGS